MVCSVCTDYVSRYGLKERSVYISRRNCCRRNYRSGRARSHQEGQSGDGGGRCCRPCCSGRQSRKGREEREEIVALLVSGLWFLEFAPSARTRNEERETI